MLLVFFNGQVVNAARADGGRSLRSEDDPVGMILEDLGVFRRLVIEGRDIHGAGEFVLDGAVVVVEARGGGAGAVLFAKSDERLEALDSWLWTYAEASF